MKREKVSTAKPWEKTVKHGMGVIVSGRVLYTSGITARDPNGNLVGPGDMHAQLEQIFRNLGDILIAAGTDFSHVVKYTIYTTDIDAFKHEQDFVREHYIDKPASTLIEVSKLVMPEMLVEVEAIVQLD